MKAVAIAAAAICLLALPCSKGADIQSVETLSNRAIQLNGTTQLHVTGAGLPMSGSTVNFTSPDAWLFLDNVRPSVVASRLLGSFQVNGKPAALGTNIRVVQYVQGAVVIPQGSDFAAMTVFGGKSQAGESMPLRCYVKYDGARLGAMKTAIGSFVLKRGYMATIAQNEDGTGISKNYVAQDHDVTVSELPADLDKNVQFIRIFPWRWTSKKGVCGDIWDGLNVGWYYNWNINQVSTPDLEYVPIKQKQYWPGLAEQDWEKIGATEVLAFNEPDHKDQSDLTVEQAIAGWPELLATGLRLGTPAVSDGGLKWLYDFIDRAKEKHLRVDFVAVHYYRSYSNPADPQGAARQLYNYVKQIHDRTGLPVWITEFNNGANWTKDPKPTVGQEKATIAAFIDMLDRTPFVERYAIYNWVEDERRMRAGDSKAPGPLTPAGEAYRDKVSPVFYTQPDSQ